MGNVVEKQMEQTCSGDVILIVDYKKDASHSRNYSLYKIQKRLDVTEANKIVYEYVMLVEGDKFPILLSKVLAQQVIADNNFGGCLAFNIYFNRYR